MTVKHSKPVNWTVLSVSNSGTNKLAAGLWPVA